MKQRFWGIAFLAIGLSLFTPALASEDPEDYPFPDGFSFDDLPDISSEAPSDETDTQSSKKQEPQPEAKESPKNDTSPSILQAPKSSKDVKAKPSGQVSASGRTITRPGDRLTIPPKNQSDDAKDDGFDKDKSLTETLKENAPEASKSPLEGTWVEKLTTSNPLSLLSSGETGNSERKAESSLEELVKGARNKEDGGKSNAAVFDISGIMLRMTLKQTERILENRGFKKINAKFEIPNFIKWRNEETCRNQGVVGYERIEACVINKAKADGHQYLQYLKYAKFDSKEEIEIYFTSNFTENKTYKIVYNSRIASITGNSPKAIYIRNLKVYDFWKKINQKYGKPNNKTTVTWGLGGNKPYLKASTGYLLLEDPMFREMDYTRMSREDQRFIYSEFYNF